MAKKTFVYVDGFNLYYSLLRLRPIPPKWLNVKTMCEIMLPGVGIERIKYFTARVSATPDDSDTPIRQQIYFRALRTIPDLTIHLGHFLSHAKRQPLAICENSPPCFINILKTEEKGSDVNLASHLLHDAHLDRFDLAVVVSGDSDLVEPIRMATQELGRRVCVINPNSRPSKQLKKFASFYRTLHNKALKNAVFPDEITDGKGVFSKPKSWSRPWPSRERRTIIEAECEQCGKLVECHRYVLTNSTAKQ